MRIYPLRAVTPDQDIISSPTSFTSDVRVNFKSYYNKGYYEKLDKTGLYIQEIICKNSRHIGLIANVATDELVKNNILPHEKTLTHKEQINMQLLVKRESMLKPVLLTHEVVPELKSILNDYAATNEPMQNFYFEDLKETHKFWQITKDSLIKKIQLIFKEKIERSYIADGHHRCQIIMNLFNRKKKKKNKDRLNFDLLFASFFSFEDLTILDYNRLVEYGNSISPLRIITELSKLGEIAHLAEERKPLKKHEITFCLVDEWFSLKIKKSIAKVFSSSGVTLDHQIFNEMILRQVFNIEDIKMDQRIKYMPGIHDTDAIYQRMQKYVDRMAFCLYPVKIQEVKTLADANKTLPPKSTYFQPRLANGLIVSDLQTE
jgi:uncharacterized protein (DUF1015 family)